METTLSSDRLSSCQHSSARLPPSGAEPARVPRRAPDAAIGPIGGLVNYTGFGLLSGGVIGSISAAYKMDKLSAVATRSLMAQHASIFGATCGTYGFCLGLFDSAFGPNKLQNKVAAASVAGAVANGVRAACGCPARFFVRALMWSHKACPGMCSLPSASSSLSRTDPHARPPPCAPLPSPYLPLRVHRVARVRVHRVSSLYCACLRAALHAALRASLRSTSLRCAPAGCLPLWLATEHGCGWLLAAGLKTGGKVGGMVFGAFMFGGLTFGWGCGAE